MSLHIEREDKSAAEANNNIGQIFKSETENWQMQKEETDVEWSRCYETFLEEI